MSDLRILLIEDDPNYAVDIQMMIVELGHDFVGIADTAEDAYKLIEIQKPDLIIADILLKGAVTGIELADNLKHLGIKIIFITAYQDDSFYEKAKKTNPEGYLVKPFHKLTLRNAIEKAIEEDSDNLLPIDDHEPLSATEAPAILKGYVFIKKNGILEKVKIDEIEYVESDRNYSEIFVNGRKFVLKLSLKKVQELLGENYFLRVNQRHIVNMNMIDSIDLISNHLVMKELQFSMGRAYRDSIIKSLKRML